MIHLAAFYSLADLGGVLTALAGVTDQVLNVQGNNVRVPAGMNFVAGSGYNADSLTAFTTSQIQAPSLRDMWYPDNPFYSLTVGWDQALAPVKWQGDSAFELVPSENMNFFAQSDAAGAVKNYGLVWLCDGPVQQVTGDIRTVRCTSSISLLDGTWVNGSLSFSQTLPYGDYQVVGMRAVGASLVAARLVFAGGVWRPGTVGMASEELVGMPQMMNGMAGDLGVFNTNTPPSLEALGHSSTSQTIFLDLIKVG